MCIVPVLVLSGASRWVFAALIVIDAFGTLTKNNTIVDIDRGLFFFAAVVVTIVSISFNLLVVTAELLGLFVALDFSFLLDRVDGTAVDRRILATRIKSYAYTALPAFLVTFLLLYLYPQNLQFSDLESAIALGLASVGVLIIVYSVVRYLVSFGKEVA